MHDWLANRVRVSPERTALVEAETGDEWDFEALDAVVSSAAGRLATLGVEAGDNVGVLLSQRPEYVGLVHAVMRIGATLVPLNARLTAAELGEQVERTDPVTLVCGSETEAMALEAAAASVPVVSVDDAAADEVETLADQTVHDVPYHDWELDDPQAVVFTSGSTGDPKAVVLTMGNLLTGSVASAFRLGVTPEDRWLLALALYHVGGLVQVLRMALYGTTVVLRTEFEAGAAADDIDKYGVTGVSVVPTMLSRMLDVRGTLADSLRVVLLGGAPAPQELIERCRNYSVPVYPTYGMTETTSQIATARPDEAFDYPGTVGRPLFWTEVSVRDEEGRELPAGETGEFVVEGPTVSPRYYDDVGREAFGPHGLRTGDLGYVGEGGRLWVVGRKSDHIVTGGENVAPAEVAEALVAHPRVADAAVIGVPDEEWGERVAALVVTDGVAAEELDAHCRERLADYKVPRRFRFVESIPRNHSGEVDREAAQARLAVEEADGDGGPDGR